MLTMTLSQHLTRPEIYGEDRFVAMFRGLHIEMAAFKLLGDLLKGTGWVTALSEADIASLGTAESFLTVSNLAKKIYHLFRCHQD
jgi:hypothetical protein